MATNYHISAECYNKLYRNHSNDEDCNTKNESFQFFLLTWLNLTIFKYLEFFDRKPNSALTFR